MIQEKMKQINYSIKDLKDIVREEVRKGNSEANNFYVDSGSCFDEPSV